jgi:hypothetical protein
LPSGAAGGLGDDAAHDLRVLREEVVPAHAGLPGEAGGHDDDVGPGGRLVVVGAGDPAVVAVHRPRLQEVQRLALGQALDDVRQDDVGQLPLDDVLRGRGAHVASPDHRHLRSRHDPSHGVRL